MSQPPVLKCPFLLGSTIRIRSDTPYRINSEWLSIDHLNVIHLKRVLDEGKCCAIEGNINAQVLGKDSGYGDDDFPSVVVKTVLAVS